MKPKKDRFWLLMGYKDVKLSKRNHRHTFPSIIHHLSKNLMLLYQFHRSEQELVSPMAVRDNTWTLIRPEQKEGVSDVVKWNISLATTLIKRYRSGRW